jgi:hypothetical protein
MTRDRHRPPQLESLEAKQLLSTLPSSTRTIGVGVVRQTSTTAVHNPTPNLAALAGESSVAGHSRIGRGAAAALAGRAPLTNNLTVGVASRGPSGSPVGSPTRPILAAGLSSFVARSASPSRSLASAASLGSARVGGGPTTVITPAPTPTVTVTVPTTNSAIAQLAQTLPVGMR